jgi:hypothetical protein
LEKETNPETHPTSLSTALHCLRFVIDVVFVVSLRVVFLVVDGLDDDV